MPVHGHVREGKNILQYSESGVDISGGGKFQPDLSVWRLVIAFCGYVRAVRDIKCACA